MSTGVGYIKGRYGTMHVGDHHHRVLVSDVVADERERIATAIEAAAQHEGVRARRVIRMCAYIARECP